MQWTIPARSAGTLNWPYHLHDLRPESLDHNLSTQAQLHKKPKHEFFSLTQAQPGTSHYSMSSTSSQYSGSGDEEPHEHEARRSIHNVLERKRRDDLRASFDGLRVAVPDFRMNDKSPKVLLLILSTQMPASHTPKKKKISGKGQWMIQGQCSGRDSERGITTYTNAQDKANGADSTSPGPSGWSEHACQSVAASAGGCCTVWAYARVWLLVMRFFFFSEGFRILLFVGVSP